MSNQELLDSITVDGESLVKLGEFSNALEFIGNLGATHSWKVLSMEEGTVRPVRNVLYTGKLTYTDNIYKPNAAERVKWEAKGRNFQPKPAIVITSALRWVYKNNEWVLESPETYHICVPNDMFEVRGLYAAIL